jgi:hypothetical protein
MERYDAIGFLQQLGAVVQPRINLQTDYVILGSQPFQAPESPSMPIQASPSSDIAQRQKDGQPIRILTQRQLLAMIPSGLAIVRGDA